MAEEISSRTIWHDVLEGARSRRLWTVIGVILLGLALAITFLYVPVVDIKAALRSAHWSGVLAAIACLVLGQLLRVWRSRRILQLRVRVSSDRIAQGLLGSQIINWLSPVRIGDVWRVLHVSDTRASNLIWTATSIVLEKSVDAFVLALFALVASLLPLPSAYATPIFRLVLTALGGAMLASATMALTSHRVRDRLLRRLPRVEVVMQRVQPDDGPTSKKYIAIWLEALLYAAGIWTLAIFTNVALATAFGINITLGEQLLLLLALQTSMLFSPIPGNIGLFSIVAVTVLTPLEIGEAQAIAYGLILWATVYGVLFLMGLLTIFLRPADRSHQHEAALEITLLGTRVHRLRLQDLLNRAETALSSRTALTIAYANAHALHLAYADKRLRAFFNNDADIVFCDGFGVKWAARIAGAPPPPDRYTPPDWIDALCERCAAAGHTVGLIGDAPGVASRAGLVLEHRHPGLRVVLTHHGFFDKTAGSLDNNSVLSQIDAARPDVLLVGMGMPVQELWLRDNRGAIASPLTITVGALFRYISGESTRAPRWMTEHGLEWLGRLTAEPGRLWRRYLIEGPLVMIRALRQRIAMLFST